MGTRCHSIVSITISHRAIPASGGIGCEEGCASVVILSRNQRDLSFCDHVPCGWLFERLILLVLPLESVVFVMPIIKLEETVLQVG